MQPWLAWDSLPGSKSQRCTCLCLLSPQTDGVCLAMSYDGYDSCYSRDPASSSVDTRVGTLESNLQMEVGNGAQGCEVLGLILRTGRKVCMVTHSCNPTEAGESL